MLATKKETTELLTEARQLAYQTPFFLTSKDILKQNYDHFTHLFDNAEIYYALKANSDPKVLSYLNSLGCGFEAASAYEVQQLLDLGVSPTKIVYGTSIKPADHIKHCFDAGVMRYAADSKEELHKLATYAPGAKIYVRAIVDDAGSVFMMSDRFGTPAHTVKDLMLFARDIGLQTYGVSFYVGSQAASADMWAKGVNKVAPVIDALYREGIVLEALNIGGGFPVHYDNHQDAPVLHDIVVAAHNAMHALPYMPKVIMEPGRGIVATSTLLVSTIIARNDRANKPWLCLDAGIYNALYEAMIHQGSTRYPIKTLEPVDDMAETLSYTLTGPTGDSLDIVARDVELPSHLQVGDKLVFEHAGAYTISMASGFNGFPPPQLYMY